MSDWVEFKKELVIQTEEKWMEAFEKIYLPRLKVLDLVNVLRENGAAKGEGFAIMAILSIITFHCIGFSF